MSNIQVPTKNQVDETSQTIFDNLEKGLGMVPNLYATIGYSSTALGAFLAYGQSVDSKNTFNAKEREVIKLAASEANECGYCISAHTAISKMNGFSEEETLEFRSGTSSNSKYAVLARISQEIALNRGDVSQETLDAFFAEGYDNTALFDLLAVVIDITFTNFAGRLAKVPVDFPAAKELVTA